MVRRAQRAAVLAIALLAPVLPAAPAASVDVTSLVEVVGEPLAARYPSGDAVFARNIWDLAAFGGRLYLGAGNASNRRPVPNAGPVDVWSFDGSAFSTEFTVDEEQIDHYRVLGGKLTIPGMDARESWALGNFYRLESGRWVKHRTVPDGVHVYDLLRFGGFLWAATNTPDGGVIYRSGDDGRTWAGFPVRSDRVYGLFGAGGRLWGDGDGALWLWSAGTFKRVPQSRFFPGVAEPRRVVRPVTFGTELVYIAGKTTNDHQWLPRGLYASASGTARKLDLPGGAIARDTQVVGTELYVLATAASSAATNILYSTTDLEAWTEVLRFDAETFARSFEILGSYAYFGLGCEATALSPATGRVLRVVLPPV